MRANAKLVSIGGHSLRPKHLLIIGVLSLSFSISFLVRSQAAEYGFELNEFDPFFNFRATEYMVENGIEEYHNWKDDLSWYPLGRYVDESSQVMLHLTAAVTYWIFGGDSTLYDFTIMFPVVFGSFTAIVLFALVRVIGGTTAGLFAAMLYSVSLPILIRGPIGWFKSEPLGLFYGVLMVYLLLSGLKAKNKKIAAAKLIGAGIFTGFALSAWGGNQFFIIPIGIFFIALPFLRSDHRFLVWAIPLYIVVAVASMLPFFRVVNSFLDGFGGIALVASAILAVTCIFIQNRSSKHKRRNGLLFLLAILVIGPSILALDIATDILPTSTLRYATVLNPFLAGSGTLLSSISEHAAVSPQQSFLFHSVLTIFSGIGIWLITKNIQNKGGFVRNDMLAFALIFGLLGVYISASFVRLEVFASVAVITLASLGLAALTKQFFRSKHESRKPVSRLIKLPYAVVIIAMLTTPMIFPVGADLFSSSNAPPTILNGGTSFGVVTNDWLDTLDWIKNNTPEDSLIAAWWDYGYWITTMSERATIADNLTSNDAHISYLARILMSPPDTSWANLRGFADTGADYVLVFVTAQKLSTDPADPLYLLRGGGDESKKQWFMRIGGFELGEYLHQDGISGTDKFWNETLLGQMIPFSLLGYVQPNDFNQQSATYVPGYLALYEKDVKYPADGDGPLRLAYASSSYTEEHGGPVIGVFVYEVNKDYVPAP
ncbi:MAG: hypothetical protein EB829_05580 [Nitrosopumilus sp. H8]|nr:MAG: hypothetical protein EB829_05580 [Nitrosopumilus sp. H8]